MTDTSTSIEAALALLRNHPDYRVLSRIPERTHYAEAGKHTVRKGVILDTETTGKVAGSDKIIELGMVAFEYDAETGQAFRILGSFNQLEDPGMPIPPEATAVNGITDEMVAGKHIDDDAVADFMKDTSLVIAHNARFDRGFCEVRFPLFENYAWGCSFEEVAWDEEGLGSAKLEFIAYKFGLFYDAHRAVSDCRALLEILQHPLPNSGEPALKSLAAFVNRSTCTIRALNSPFSTKDALKGRGYRWDAEIRTWHTTVLSRTAMEEEIAWLKEHIYSGNTATLEFEVSDAMNRYSGRPGKVQSKHY